MLLQLEINIIQLEIKDEKFDRNIIKKLTMYSNFSMISILLQ